MMSHKIILPTRSLVPRCQCGGLGRLTIRQSRRYASSKTSKVRPVPPSPSAKPPAKPKALPYKPSAHAPPLSQPAAPSSSQEPQPVSDILRKRFIPIFGMGAAALCLGSALASLVYHWHNDEVVRYPPGREPQVPTGRASIQSPVEFDLHLDKSEWRLGITKLRRRLAEQAQGHVLEVAIGAGRNLEYYDWAPVTDVLLTPTERTKMRLDKNDWAGLRRDKSATTAEGQQDEQQQQQPVAKGVQSFTGIDISPAMLDIAMKRMRSVVPYLSERGQLPAKPVWTLFSQHAAKPTTPLTSGGVEATYALLNDKIRIMQCDAQVTMPAPPPLQQTQYYDTILQTFGLCSVRDPVSLIANMARLARPDVGRIILVEHGLSVWELVNGLLDRSARGHFERFGCWWNRDVEVIVHEAVRRVPGLEIVAFERPGWVTGGTHLWVELRMNSSSGGGDGGGGEGGSGGGGVSMENPAADNTKTDGWFGLGSLLTVKKKNDEDRNGGGSDGGSASPPSTST